MRRWRLAVLLAIAFCLSFLSSGFGDSLCELSGVLVCALYTYKSYELQLDGGTGRFPLRGDLLRTVPEGTRIWVWGEIKTSLYKTDSDYGSVPRAAHWEIYMEVKDYRRIEKPFRRPEE